MYKQHTHVHTNTYTQQRKLPEKKVILKIDCMGGWAGGTRVEAT